MAICVGSGAISFLPVFFFRMMKMISTMMRMITTPPEHGKAELKYVCDLNTAV